MVPNLLRPYREFAPSYFHDIFIHSRAEDDMTDVEVHLDHLHQVFEVMRENMLYANLKKCIFCAPEIPVLGSYVSKEGVRADQENVEAISAFVAVETSLFTAPVLMLVGHTKPFHVVCDASDFAIDCALMQFDDEGRERVVSYQSRQLKPAERSYPVHEKDLLAMRYALIKFRVYLLAGQINILADTLSRRPDYVQSGRHAIGDEDDDECAACVSIGVAAVEVTVTSSLRESFASTHEADASCSDMIKYLRDPSDTARHRLSPRSRARIDRYALDGSLLTYCVDRADSPRVIFPLDEDLRARLIHKFHDTPSGGHLGREKTFASLSRDFYWPSGSGSGGARVKRASV
ncbi:reverse transcriptase [Phytophthora megakarya]|uniref:Reverse transcriptase n=1 Tax=Phytophthora megakarya TaxID=4795 RepID=A0A225V125_9STRA|nr:reverse transcriptase [Phytophthora megakarya]